MSAELDRPRGAMKKYGRDPLISFGVPSAPALGRQVARVAGPHCEMAFDRFENVVLGRRAVGQHTPKGGPTLRCDDVAVQADVELSELPFFDRNAGIESPAEFRREIFGPFSITTGLAITNFEIHLVLGRAAHRPSDPESRSRISPNIASEPLRRENVIDPGARAFDAT